MKDTTMVLMASIIMMLGAFKLWELKTDLGVTLLSITLGSLGFFIFYKGVIER